MDQRFPSWGMRTWYISRGMGESRLLQYRTIFTKKNHSLRGNKSSCFYDWGCVSPKELGTAALDVYKWFSETPEYILCLIKGIDNNWVSRLFNLNKINTSITVNYFVHDQIFEKVNLNFFTQTKWNLNTFVQKRDYKKSFFSLSVHQIM